MCVLSAASLTGLVAVMELDSVPMVSSTNLLRLKSVTCSAPRRQKDVEAAGCDWGLHTRTGWKATHAGAALPTHLDVPVRVHKQVWRLEVSVNHGGGPCVEVPASGAQVAWVAGEAAPALLPRLLNAPTVGHQSTYSMPRAASKAMLIRRFQDSWAATAGSRRAAASTEARLPREQYSVDVWTEGPRRTGSSSTSAGRTGLVAEWKSSFLPLLPEEEGRWTAVPGIQAARSSSQHLRLACTPFI